MAQYDADHVARYFDDFGDNEWDRLERDPEAEVNFAVHLHYLVRYVEPDWRVLEVGAGAGRFTIELARLGCTVVATDVSPVQLQLNAQMVEAAGCAGAVEARTLLDVVDMSELGDASFDAVVCYGGPLSYAMDRAGDALAECVRVTTPGGPLLFSVMSLWGSAHKGLPFVAQVSPEANRKILSTGDITAEALPGHQHYCHGFRAEELQDLLRGAGLTIEAVAASTFLTTGWRDQLAEVRADPERWNALVEMEIEACAQPGCIEGGPHMIAVARKPG